MPEILHVEAQVAAHGRGGREAIARLHLLGNQLQAADEAEAIIGVSPSVKSLNFAEHPLQAIPRMHPLPCHPATCRGRQQDDGRLHQARRPGRYDLII